MPSSVRMLMRPARWAKQLEAIRKAGSSVGAVIGLAADGVPAGLGAPIYGKLDADLASALMSINCGQRRRDRRWICRRRTQRRRQCRRDIDPRRRAAFRLQPRRAASLGGITTGQTVTARFAVKPTSSILTPRRSVTRDGREVEVTTRGRHDPLRRPCAPFRWARPCWPVCSPTTCFVTVPRTRRAPSLRECLHRRPQMRMSRRCDDCFARNHYIDAEMSSATARSPLPTLNAFVALVGGERWKARLASLGGPPATGWSGRALLQRHAIELMIERLASVQGRGADHGRARDCSLGRGHRGSLTPRACRSKAASGRHPGRRHAGRPDLGPVFPRHAHRSTPACPWLQGHISRCRAWRCLRPVD